MEHTSVSEQFKKKYPEYKEYSDFMSLLDPNKKTIINRSNFVLKSLHEINKLIYFKLSERGLHMDLYTDHKFDWRKNTDYFIRLFNAFVEWVDEDLFIRENGMGEYDYEEIVRWDVLFERLNDLPTEGTRVNFNIIKEVDRKQQDNYIKQIKKKLKEKKTKTEKLDLLHELRISEHYNHYPELTDWIGNTIYMIKNDRYEDVTTDIEGHLNLTERLILLNLFVDEGLFPDLFNPSGRTVAERKIRLFFSKLFNKPESSFENSIEKANKEDDKLTNKQIDPRIKNLERIHSMLSNIEDAEGINVIIEKIEGRINKLKNK